MIAPATCGTAVWAVLKPTPRSSRYCMTPQMVSRPKALPPASTTPSMVATKCRASRNSRPWTPAARPRISTPPTAGRSTRMAVQPVRPAASVTWPTRTPGITARPSFGEQRAKERIVGPGRPRQPVGAEVDLARVGERARIEVEPLGEPAEERRFGLIAGARELGDEAVRAAPLVLVIADGGQPLDVIEEDGGHEQRIVADGPAQRPLGIRIELR